jgi:hypothetical protein
MKYIYNGHRKFLILHPVDKMVEKGTVIETTDKQFSKDLLEMGFEKVKQDKNEEGE